MTIRKEKQFDFNGKTLKAEELTAVQIDEWRTSLDAEKGVAPPLPDMLLNRSIPLSAVRLAVPDLTDADLGAAPSELAKIYDAVEEVNPFFLKMTENMATLGEALLNLDN
jgi:hypothetical protein